MLCMQKKESNENKLFELLSTCKSSILNIFYFNRQTLEFNYYNYFISLISGIINIGWAFLSLLFACTR